MRRNLEPTVEWPSALGESRLQQKFSTSHQIEHSANIRHANDTTQKYGTGQKALERD